MLRRLLAEIAGRFPAVSLSVRVDNPARRLYERLGFAPVAGSDVPSGGGTISVTMVRRG